MKRFSFRLEPLLNLRERKLEEVEIEVQMRQANLSKEQDRLRQLSEEKTGLRKQILVYGQSMQYFMVELARKYESGLDFSITTQELRVQDAYRHLQQAKIKRSQAMQELKIVEKLEIRARQRHKDEQEQKNQKFLDEIGVMKAARQQEP